MNLPSGCVVFLLACIFFILPSVTYGQTPASEVQLSAQLAALQKLIAALQAQLIGVQSVGAAPASTEWQYDRPDEASHDEEDADGLVSGNERISLFKIRGDKADFYDAKKWSNVDEDLSESVWEAFRDVAGKAFIEKHIDEFVAFDRSDVSTLGFVMRFPNRNPTWTTASNKGNGWGLGVNIAKTDFENKVKTRELLITLIHEYARAMTLNDDQVEYKLNSASYCKKKRGTYFLPLSETRERGCSRSDSYVNAFVDSFWDDKQIRESNAAWNGKDSEEYFEDNDDEFVTWYATRNPMEDIAESFTDFILMRKPVGNKVRDQKTLFFYRYPELVTLRTEIRGRIQHYFE